MHALIYKVKKLESGAPRFGFQVRGLHRGRQRVSSRNVWGKRRDSFIDNLLVRIHLTIVMIRWTGLAPWEFEFPFPGSLTSTFLAWGKNMAVYRALPMWYRGTSLIRNQPPLGPYSRTMSRAL